MFSSSVKSYDNFLKKRKVYSQAASLSARIEPAMTGTFAPIKSPVYTLMRVLMNFYP